MLASDVIQNIRYSLSDTDANAYRWSDARIMQLLNEGINDIAKNTTLFVETVFVALADGMPDLDLSGYATKFVRAEYLDLPIPIKSFEEMDKNNSWQKEEGDTLKALVYNKQRNGVLRTYPILKNAYNPYITYSQLYGITTDITYSDIAPVMANHYGDISFVPNDALVKLYYVRQHAKITTLSQELIIDELCEKPLILYVVGNALLDNQDTQNVELGSTKLQLYYSAIAEYAAQKEEGYVRTHHTTRYTGAFND